MNPILLALISGLGGVIVGTLLGHFSQRSLLRLQLKAAEESHTKLLKQMLEDRQLLNIRLGQISSNTNNIAHALKQPPNQES